MTGKALAAGSDGISRHRRLLTYIADLLAPGRDQGAEGERLPQSAERAIAGGLLGMAAERLAGDRSAELPALAPEAIEFALTPFLGVREAKRLAASAERSGPASDR